MSSPGLQLAPNARDDLCGDVAEGAGVSTADEVTRHLDAASDFAVCFDDDLHRCVHSLIRAIDVLASHGRPSPMPAGEGGTDCLGPADHPEPASAVDSDEGRLCDKQDGASRNFLIAEDNAGPSDRGGGAANVSEGVTAGETAPKSLDRSCCARDYPEAKPETEFDDGIPADLRRRRTSVLVEGYGIASESARQHFA